MFAYEIKIYIEKLSSYRKNLFLKFENGLKNKKQNDNEIKKILEDINKVTYTEDFLNKLESIYIKKQL